VFKKKRKKKKETLQPTKLTLFQLNVTHYLSIDFGMMGEFRQDLRDGFIEACLHLVNRDFDALAKDFVTLG